MKLTNEQIEQILDGAPDGATHCFDYGDYFKHGDPFALVWDEKGAWFASAMCKKDVTHNLSDLREILELRQEVEQLQQRNDELAATVEQITKDLTDLSNAHATDEQYRMFIGGMAKEIKARTTPQQNLNAVKREAILDAINHSDGRYIETHSDYLDMVIEYANTKYPSVKD